MSGNWLDEPIDQTDAWLGPTEQRDLTVPDPIPSSELATRPAAVPPPIEIPVDASGREEAFTKAWDALDPKQQMLIHQLRASRFNMSDACRELAKNHPEYASHRTTAVRWLSSDANFIFVHKVLFAVARNRVIDPDRLLVRADEIAEKALEPVPILHQGRPTGFYERSLDTALRANEQLMKTQKMLGNDDTPRGAVEGPALIIQVVQRDRTVIDVTPKNVTIELPPPEDDPFGD